MTAIRKRGRDPVESQRRLLESALLHFARAGLNGARVEEIVADAGLSQRMLYHYFGDKEGLYVATLEHAYEGIRRAEAALDLASLPPLDGIRRLTEFTYDYYHAEPACMALLHQENLLDGRFVRRSDRARALQATLLDSLDDLIRRGRTNGVIRRPIDAVQLYIDIAGLAYFALSNRHTLSAIFGRDLGDPAFLAERRRHIGDVVIAAVTAPPLAAEAVTTPQVTADRSGSPGNR